MKCHVCGKNIKKGFKWLEKIWCRECFGRERNRISNLSSVDLNYEFVEDRDFQQDLTKWLNENKN
jgi:hypothetical protein